MIWPSSSASLVMWWNVTLWKITRQGNQKGRLGMVCWSSG
jgi:hypothetical protein